MGFSLNDLGLTFASVFGNHNLRLESVSDWTDFDTKSRLGSKYRLRDEELCIKFDVKLRDATPIISNEDVRKSAKKIYMTVNARDIGFYGKSVYDADVAIIADSISIKQAANTVAKQSGFPSA